jgi:sugar phosphate isomerase/epimerase
MKKIYRFGVSTTIDYSIDIKSQIKIISESGFDFLSVGARMEHSRFLDDEGFLEVIGRAIDANLSIESAHFPIGEKFDIASPNSNIVKSAVDLLLEFCHKSLIYGIPIVILHPHDYFGKDKDGCFERAALALETIFKLKPEAIHIALENLPGNESRWIFAKIMEAFEPHCFGFCYDSSHDNIGVSPFGLLKDYYFRITACHLSDNHGQSDEHLVPGDGNIDWKKLREYFDRADNITDILLEVGTGEKLEEPLALFAGRIRKMAEKYFR